MLNFPLVILDNFFKDPDKIKEFALQQEFKTFEEANYPGLRTECLSKIHPKFFSEIIEKFFCIYYDLALENITFKASAYFQLVDKKYNSGWVHQDNTQKVSSIIFLSKNPPLNSGTSIYKLKDNILIPNISSEDKWKYYISKGQDNILKQKKDESNSQFDEIVNVSNVYNRLISFDSKMFHSAQNFYGENQESRLTLIFFIEEIYAKNRPLERVQMTQI
jgi:hypothetical protein